MSSLVDVCSCSCSSSGFEENLEVQGELILQDSFQVWDPRSLIRKGRDRHLFLFEFSLVFSKEIKDSAGRTKYQYKNRLLVSVSVLLCMILTVQSRDHLSVFICYFHPLGSVFSCKKSYDVFYPNRHLAVSESHLPSLYVPPSCRRQSWV